MARDNKELNVNTFKKGYATKYEDREIVYNMNTVPFEWHFNRAIELIPANSKVIDIGCGTAELTRKIAQKKRGNYLGVDLSPDMIAEAKRKTEGISSFKFETMDSENLAVKDNAYKIAIMRGAIHHFPHPEKALAEAYRILEESGQLHILDMLSYEDKITDEFFNKVNTIRQPANFRFYPRSVLERMCNKAGFKTSVVLEYPITMEIKRWLRTFHNYNQVINLFETANETVKESIHLRNKPRSDDYLADFVAFYLIASK